MVLRSLPLLEMTVLQRCFGLSSHQVLMTHHVDFDLELVEKDKPHLDVCAIV